MSIESVIVAAVAARGRQKKGNLVQIPPPESGTIIACRWTPPAKKCNVLKARRDGRIGSRGDADVFGRTRGRPRCPNYEANARITLPPRLGADKASKLGGECLQLDTTEGRLLIRECCSCSTLCSRKQGAAHASLLHMLLKDMYEMKV